MSNLTKLIKWTGVKNSIERTITAFLKGAKLTFGIKDLMSAEINFAEVLNPSEETVLLEMTLILYILTQRHFLSML